MTARRLVVDWPACAASGRCYAAAPELVTADEWGYPLVPPGDLQPAQAGAAQRAAAACPRQALHVLVIEPTASTRREKRRR